MAKRGGFPGMGMPGNMNNLMKQAQKMQRQMEENQKALEEKEFTAAAGGGAVEVTVSGKREVTKVKLAEEVVDPDDIEMLEDLIVAATADALRRRGGRSRQSKAQGAGGGGSDMNFLRGRWIRHRILLYFQKSSGKELQAWLLSCGCLTAVRSSLPMTTDS